MSDTANGRPSPVRVHSTVHKPGWRHVVFSTGQELVDSLRNSTWLVIPGNLTIPQASRGVTSAPLSQGVSHLTVGRCSLGWFQGVIRMTDIKVVRASEREVSEADATAGMVREQALVDDSVWVGLVRTAPNRPSGWHHHGDHDTYIYVDSGKIRMEFGSGGSKVVEAEAGDFLHVPQRVVHREVNPSDEQGAVILVRVGTGPPVVNVDGPADT